MKTTTSRLLTLVAVGALALAGCSATDSSADSPAASTAESTAASSPSADATQDSDASTQDATVPVVPDDVVPPEDLPNEPVGSEITVAGEPATVCVYGDGYGTSVWAGGSGTSCELVQAVYDAMTAGLDDADVLHDVLVTEVTATDPGSGVEHVLACAPRGEALTTCVADGATVHVY